jgi:hypothetical protein
VDDTRPNLPSDPGADPLLLRARLLLDETRYILWKAREASAGVRATVALLRAQHDSPPDRPAR